MPSTPLTDLYYELLRGRWVVVLGLFLLGYLLINVIFALLYLAGGDCIAGAEPGSFADAFFFSVQTLATIGYGGLLPKTTYANVLVTIEALVGALGFALATGLAFSKFARPQAKVLFSRVAVIAPYDGRKSLYFRAANVRGNDVVEAMVRVAVIRNHQTKEGHPLRRLVDLELVRERQTLFRLSWLIVHVIDEHSPLHGLDAEALARERAMIVVSMTGLDATFSQTIHARHVYLPSEVVFDRHFVDIITDLPDGRIEIDYSKFHDTRPLSRAELAAGGREAIESEEAEELAAEVEQARCESEPG